MAEVHPLDPPNRAGDGATHPETIGRKRQRRPSIRLGDIGGAGNRQFRAQSNLAGTLGEEKEFNLDAVAIGSWKVRDIKRQVAALPAAAKRPRSNWSKDSKLEDTGANGSNGLEDDVAEEGEEGYSGREFNVDDSESPIGDGNSGPSDNDVVEYGNDNVGCSGRWGGEDAVRIWLNSIGLGRYAPVFEVHEVDDEVLPMLTLEDLKDMGITAVGSRRKMFCAIQKLGKGFS